MYLQRPARKPAIHAEAVGEPAIHTMAGWEAGTPWLVAGGEGAEVCGVGFVGVEAEHAEDFGFGVVVLFFAEVFEVFVAEQQGVAVYVLFDYSLQVFVMLHVETYSCSAMDWRAAILSFYKLRCKVFFASFDTD